MTFVGTVGMTYCWMISSGNLSKAGSQGPSESVSDSSPVSIYGRRLAVGVVRAIPVHLTMTDTKVLFEGAVGRVLCI